MQCNNMFLQWLYPWTFRKWTHFIKCINSLFEKYGKEYGEVRAAFDQRNSVKEAADELYIRHFTIARVALKKSKAASTTLNLSVRAPRTHSAWLNRTRGFYKNTE